MKYILTATLALSLLSGTAVMAQSNNQNRTQQSGDRNDWDRNDQTSSRDWQDNDSRARSDISRWSRGDRLPIEYRKYKYVVTDWKQIGLRKPPRDHRWISNDNSNYFLVVTKTWVVADVVSRSWSRGDRLPSQYRKKQYVVTNWKQLGLTKPPSGKRWISSDNSNYFLVVTKTWVVSDVAYRNDRNVRDDRDDRDQRWRDRYSRSYTYNDDVFYQDCRNSPDPAGVIIGALIGGLLGNTAGRDGNRAGTTAAGVIVGGVVGAALTSNLNCDDRSYAYKSYYDGFNSGRSNTNYQWRNPSNNHRGEFRVGDYYNDSAGFNCADYSQTIYVRGRPQEARGTACRQPDGSWAVVS